MNIRNKMIVYFLISILIPSMIITAVMYIGSINIINTKMDELTEKNLTSVQMVVQQRLSFINELTTLISMNPLISEVLSADSTEDIATNVTEIITLDRAMDSYYLSNYYASTSSPIIPTIYLINKPHYQSFDISNKVQDISSIEKKKWYQAAENQNTAVVVSPEDKSVYITRHLYDFKNVDTAEYAALLTVALETSYFTNLLNTYKTTPGSKIVILDADNQVILSSGDLLEKEQALIHSLAAESQSSLRSKSTEAPVIVSMKSLENIDWKIASITPLTELSSGQDILVRIVIVVLAICMIAALLMAILLARNFSKPILALVKSMSTIRDGNFEIDITYDKKDEFGYLIDQYKHMIHQTEDLIDKLYISEMNEKKAELQAKDAQLRALQAQINPHFLYNTLDSINLYAIKHDVPVISHMINSLANFFRYSLRKGKDIITIGEEVEHTQSYLEIQSMRFGPRLQYSFHIPGALRNAPVVKLVMQPLVENAILHGFATKVGTLELIISARQAEGSIVISVQDNGTGGNAEELNRLLIAEGNASESFAINNVHQRLQSAFGPSYGLHYKKNKTGGITVEVTVPASLQREDTYVTGTAGG